MIILLLFFIICQLFSNYFCRNISTRVAGGSYANLGEYPFVALSINANIKCTAVIISENYILGAAHCYWVNNSTMLPQDVTIITGITNIHQINRFHVQKRSAQQIHLNPYFKEKKIGRNDLALVLLNQTLTFNEFTSAIPINNRPFPVGEEVPCTAIGWGDTSKNIEAKNLFKLKVKAEHSPEACHGLSEQQYSSLICVAESSSGRGLCDGDSGGPLINNGQLIGIAHQVYTEVSDDEPDLDLECGMKGLVHTFMFVCKHLKWIKTYENSIPKQPAHCFKRYYKNKIEKKLELKL